MTNSFTCTHKTVILFGDVSPTIKVSIYSVRVWNTNHSYVIGANSSRIVERISNESS